MKLPQQIILATYFLFLPIIVFSQVNKPTKHALLFAISDYPEIGGWDKLSSSNDIAHISKALQWIGFQSTNIVQVTDEKVTVSGIKDAFSELNNRIKKGDIVFIHFSGHGTQVEADRDNKIDGLDECLVPYDALSLEKIDINDSTQLKKEMGKYLRGHVLGDLLKQIRSKLGNSGDLVVTLDFCCSGGATRGTNKVRGGKAPLVSKHFDPSKHKYSDSTQLFKQTISSSQDQSLAPYNVISATRPEELDTETKDENGKEIGPLSYALYQSFLKLDPNISYRSFFARIQSMMNISAQEQHPVLEGNAQNRTLFGGSYLQQKAFFEINEIVNDKKITVKGGAVAGLGVGAKLMLHLAGTTDPTLKKPITKGTVVISDNFMATVQLDEPINFKQVYDAWVFVSEPIFNINPVSLQIVTNESKTKYAAFTIEEAKKIETALTSFPSVELHAKPELLLVKGNQTDSLIVASNGYLFSEIKKASNNTEELKTKLKQYIQHQFLLGLQANTDGISMEVKLVPVINGKADTNLIESKKINGLYEFEEGDEITLSIKNTGKKPAYINILDLQPDGIINAILPRKVPTGNETPLLPNSLRYIPGGSSFIFDPKDFKIKIFKPYGNEVFKIFVSEKEIDLEDIANSKGAATRGDLSVLELILKDSYKGVHKRGNEKADGTISEILFRIKPASQK